MLEKQTVHIKKLNVNTKGMLKKFFVFIVVFPKSFLLVIFECHTIPKRDFWCHIDLSLQKELYVDTEHI